MTTLEKRYDRCDIGYEECRQANSVDREAAFTFCLHKGECTGYLSTHFEADSMCIMCNKPDFTLTDMQAKLTTQVVDSARAVYTLKCTYRKYFTIK